MTKAKMPGEMEPVVKPRQGVREKLGLLAAMAVAAGFAGMFKTRTGPRLGWRRPKPSAWNDMRRVEAAQAKRERRRARTLDLVARGAFGKDPFVRSAHA